MDRNFHVDNVYLQYNCRRMPNRNKKNRNLSTWAIFEGGGRLRGNVRTSSIARWKARVRLPIRRNWTFFGSSYRWSATTQNVPKLAFRRGGSVWAKISKGRGRPSGMFFGFYNTGHILLSDSANCTVLRAVDLTQYRRVTVRQTDRQTDGRNCCS